MPLPTVARAMQQKQRQLLEPDPPRRGVNARSRRANPVFDPSDTEFRMGKTNTARPVKVQKRDVPAKKRTLPQALDKTDLKCEESLSESSEKEEVEGFQFTSTS